MHGFKPTVLFASSACRLCALVVSMGCAANLGKTIPEELLAREHVCLAVNWITPPPGLEGRQAPDTLILRPDEGQLNGFATAYDYDLWGGVSLAQSQQDRGYWVWGMARDSLQIWGSSALETVYLGVVHPASEGAAEWFYHKDLGANTRGRARLRRFECRIQVSLPPNKRMQLAGASGLGTLVSVQTG